MSLPEPNLSTPPGIQPLVEAWFIPLLASCYCLEKLKPVGNAEQKRQSISGWDLKSSKNVVKSRECSL